MEERDANKRKSSRHRGTQHIVKDYSEGGTAIKSGRMHTYSAVIWNETIKFQRYQQV